MATASDDAPKTVAQVLPVALTDCPLLKNSPEAGPLIESFNKAVAQLNLFGSAFGRDLDQDEALIELSHRLLRTRTDLVTKLYSIGFIGPTQNGKSTAINYVLDVINPDDQPCREGAGDNTTSTMSRIRRGSRGVKLFYVNDQQFLKKRAELCEAAGLNPDAQDEDILIRIKNHLPLVTSGLAPSLANGKAILPHDVIKLEELLLARQADALRLPRNRRLNSPPVEVPYDDREKYLNYVQNADADNPLLQEAEISFDSAYLPAELEMFDLPGPGAKSIIDECTTRQYLPHMNGVMLFVEVTKLGNEVVERLYAQLRTQFKDRVHKRVWVVLTRWDGPQSAALVGDGKDTTFSAIKSFMADKRLPASQIRFVCSPWYKRSPNVPEEHFKALLGSDSPYPSTLSENDELYPRFTELLEKGGILSLRQLVLEVIPHDVRQEILETAERDLRTIRADLKRRFSHEVRKRTASRSQATQASKCEEDLNQLLMRIKRDLQPFEKVAVDLRNDLRETFHEHCRSPESLNEFREVPIRFPRHTRILEERLLNQVQTSVIPRLYGAWQTNFDSLPPVEIMESPQGEMLTPGLAWRQFSEQDEKGFNSRLLQFPTFLDVRLFAKGGDPAAEADLEDGYKYQAMMEEKICLTAQQAVHVIRNVLLERGLTIKRELGQLVAHDEVMPVRAADFDSVLQEMGELAV